MVLSNDATKPRLKWTPELHQRFVQAVTQLGGADKATPKTLLREMGIPGLTLYRLKSHLQKYRMGKSQQKETFHDNKQEDDKMDRRRESHSSEEVGDGNQNQINESFRVAQALEMQMEVQRELHEQIEVQRHLQLRIEAQGKYLQSVLKKAQETLSGYDSPSVGVEVAKAELSQLVSMIDNGRPSSPLLSVSKEKNPMGGTGCSLESSLISSESSRLKDEKPLKNESGGGNKCLPKEKGVPSNQVSGRKRSGSIISDGNCYEQPYGKSSQRKRGGDQLRKFRLIETFDLNDFDSGPIALDLN